ncbi:MAG: glycosyltransferase [Bacteroidales bacterium]|nr:glycosyltransferase [Bacteroidales bacterium]
MEKTELPLVSVPVITYNSSKTIVETLDSIYNQTYKNIELIISDDCSTDNTIDICQKWISAHNKRFYSTKIIKSPINTGVSANCNRAEDACNGEWEKMIAGDDILFPKCIETFLKYVGDRTDLPCIFSRVQCFSAIDGKIVDLPFDYDFFSLSREQQLNKMVYNGNCIPAPGIFTNIVLMRRLGIRNDERIPFLEDYPKWINILNAGYKLELIDQELVKYRVSCGISTMDHSLPFKKSIILTILLYMFPEWEKRDPVDAIARLDQHIDYYLKQYYNSLESISNIFSSDEYRIGKMMKKRFKIISSFIIRIGDIKNKRRRNNSSKKQSHS